MWRTRTLSNITGATFVAGYNGLYSYVQSDSTNMNAGAVRATAVTVANLEFINAWNAEAGVQNDYEFSNDHVEVNMVRGDYIIITNDSTTGVSDVVIRWGEEV
jgi:hypothetical protein